MFNRYSYVLLLTGMAGLAAAGQVNATESPATPGPSVGHRPVTSALILSANGNFNDITSAATSLKVGDVIGLAHAYGDDKDGDADKAGAYCVWYRVDPNTGTETEASKPVATDRNCRYTVQSADVGFKIKNTITIFSDQDIATASGFTINPIDSWPVSTMSANIVTSLNNMPFDHIQVEKYRVSIPTAFPVTAYEGAQMHLALTSTQLPNNALNTTYDWYSSAAPAVTVNGVGSVTFNHIPPNPDVSIVAKAKDGTHSYSYQFRISKFFITHPNGTSMNKKDSDTFCTSNGYQAPKGNDVSNGGALRQVGYLLNEWGSFANRTPWNGGAYHTTEGFVSLTNGVSGNSNDVNVVRGVICVKNP
ncbi:hypothetical protein KDR40_004863 [Salmonella enterica subsp. enterica serovar Saintpaul]|nr:hypothetical protein [Salmonella enterica subsp. enterica serovar Saintpaul]